MSNEKKKFRVVLVDDDENFCEFMGFLLSKEFDAKCYTDPKEALIRIEEDIPDLVLLDLAMPKLNGFGLLNYLKRDLKEKTPKIVIITALNFTDDGKKIDEEYVKSIGADGLIKKDEDLVQAVEKIKNLLLSSNGKS